MSFYRLSARSRMQGLPPARRHHRALSSSACVYGKFLLSSPASHISILWTVYSCVRMKKSPPAWTLHYNLQGRIVDPIYFKMYITVIKMTCYTYAIFCEFNHAYSSYCILPSLIYQTLVIQYKTILLLNHIALLCVSNISHEDYSDTVGPSTMHIASMWLNNTWGDRSPHIYY